MRIGIIKLIIIITAAITIFDILYANELKVFPLGFFEEPIGQGHTVGQQQIHASRHQIQIGFVDRDRFDNGCDRLQDLEDLLGDTGVFGHVRAQIDRIRAAAVRLGIRHLAAEVDGQPLYIVGYSNGAALAVEYALSTLEDPELPRVAGLGLVSPAIGVSPVAALAGSISIARSRAARANPIWPSW